MADNRYWIEIAVGFVLILIALLIYSVFYQPVPDVKEGFTEDFCISLMAKHNPDVKNIQFTDIRSGSQLYKDGVFGEENNTIRAFLQANRYEGLLEFCRLSVFSDNSSLPELPEHRFSCELGDLSMQYGVEDEYSYIFQEVRLNQNKRIEFLKNAFNLTDVGQLTNDLFNKELGSGDLYQSSIIYVNPQLPDIYAIHLDGFVDTLSILGCQGELPQDFIEKSGYQTEITVKTS